MDEQITIVQNVLDNAVRNLADLESANKVYIAWEQIKAKLDGTAGNSNKPTTGKS